MRIEYAMKSAPQTGAEMVAIYTAARKRLGQVPLRATATPKTTRKYVGTPRGYIHAINCEPPPAEPLQPPSNIELAIWATCLVSGFSRSDLISQRRTKDVTIWRQIAMYVAKTVTLFSLPQIGRRFGDRDHTTVLHAVRKISALACKDENIAGDVLAIIDAMKTVRP